MPRLRIKPVKPTPEELAKANAFAKDFATRKGLLIANDAHVGKTIPKFVDEKGNEVSGESKLPARTITDIRQVPSYVTAGDIKYDNGGIPYYKDQSSGDIQYIHPDIARSSRFNPNRGKTPDLIAKK